MIATRILLVLLLLMPGTLSAATNQEVKLFYNFNIEAVSNNPSKPTVVSTQSAYTIASISTYHWNDGKGALPGRISLKSENGNVYGPWQATGVGGSNGVQNALWEARPNVVIPAGNYTVIDSDPATWAYNAQSGGRGFTLVKGALPLTASGEVVLLDTKNIDDVGNNPSQPSVFILDSSFTITYLFTYHWNNSRGTTAGTIALRDQNGEIYGPWPVTARGQGSAPNAVWEVTLNVTLPAGKYTVVDSDPATWSCNVQSGNKGFVTVRGVTPAPPPTAEPPPANVAVKPPPLPSTQEDARPAVKTNQTPSEPSSGRE